MTDEIKPKQHSYRNIVIAKPNEFYEEAIWNNQNMNWSYEELKHSLDVTYKDILAERKEWQKRIDELELRLKHFPYSESFVSMYVFDIVKKRAEKAEELVYATTNEFSALLKEQNADIERAESLLKQTADDLDRIGITLAVNHGIASKECRCVECRARIKIRDLAKKLRNAE